MKVIFLNCWYAKENKNLFKFLENEMPDTDIFCFVEVNPTNFKDFSNTLSGFQGYYSTYDLFTISNCIYGQAIFVKKKLKVTESGKFKVYKNLKNDVGFIQHMSIKTGNSNLHIANIHGKTRPGHKLDTPTRIKQSEKIIKFFGNLTGPVIIGGDFNLFNKTKSVSLFELNEYRDLIKEFKIKDTRGKINKKIYQSSNIQYYADYCFVSKDVKVKTFTVPDLEVSDHLPLILEFEI